MKNKILISILLVSFFNYIGCYSYSILTEEEISSSNPPPYEDLRLVLKDNTEIEFGSLTNHIFNGRYYLKVDKPVKYVLGRGDMMNLNTRLKSAFEGFIEGEQIDSFKTNLVDNEYFTIYWTKDRERVSFKAGDYMEFLPDQGTGYFILKPPDSVLKISFDEVKEIQTSQINWYVVVPITVVVIGLMIYFLNTYQPSKVSIGL